MTSRRAKAVTAVAVGALFCAVSLVGCTNTDAADQVVIDRLVTLDVLTAPPGATEIVRASTKGGGNSAIRNTSTVTVTWASPRTPAEVGKDFHARLDRAWNFKDNRGGPLGGWEAIGGLGDAPATVATVQARQATATDNVARGTQSLVTATVSATRPS